MSTVILSAASPTRAALQTLEHLLVGELKHRGETDVRVVPLATTPLAYCQGEFDCWVKTPGVCRAKDAEAEIVQQVHDADAVVLLDEVTFGGHSYTIKRAQDRLICLISPMFEKRAALTHHEARYERLPALYALGWTHARDAEIARTWNDLADANALNLLAPHYGAAVVVDAGQHDWTDAVQSLLASQAIPGATIAGRPPLHDALLAAARADATRTPHVAPRTAAIVLGSAKVKGTSVSENLAAALAAQLTAAGVATTTHRATDFLRDEPARATAVRVAAADLLVLVAPLYVDGFPALATHALELVSSARRDAGAPARFAAVVNCGFPEAEHTRTAFRIARHFAAASRYQWAGGLPLGGGGAIDPKVPLADQHGPAEHVKAAVALAAPALASGASIPDAAVEKMATSPMPDAVYRVMGDLGWRYQVYKNGLAQSALRARPLD